MHAREDWGPSHKNIDLKTEVIGGEMLRDNSFDNPSFNVTFETAI